MNKKIGFDNNLTIKKTSNVEMFAKNVTDITCYSSIKCLKKCG